jgi:hypothetical protein
MLRLETPVEYKGYRDFDLDQMEEIQDWHKHSLKLN